MVDVSKIVEKIQNRQFEFSKYAIDQSIIKEISVSEIEQVFSENALIIEDYPNDKYGPSCLILGYTKNKRPIHVQCSYSDRPLVKLITVYQPNPDLWIDDKLRKSE